VFSRLGELLDRIRKYGLAPYLNRAPETLSRLKRNGGKA
jgi:hypothetical protein